MDELTIIDYGAGNILSVARALEHFNKKITITSEASVIKKSECLIFPGVGAFPEGMKKLHTLNLTEPIREHCTLGKPFLGICLGMQMMFDSSEEFGYTEGLGIIPGKVKAIPLTDIQKRPHKIPHIGWNHIRPSGKNNPWANTILETFPPGESVYFVHSYAAIPDDIEFQLAECDYNGRIFPAVVRKGNAYGCQFHPEKSGPGGLEILRKFIQLKKE